MKVKTHRGLARRPCAASCALTLTEGSRGSRDATARGRIINSWRHQLFISDEIWKWFRLKNNKTMRERRRSISQYLDLIWSVEPERITRPEWRHWLVSPPLTLLSVSDLLKIWQEEAAAEGADEIRNTAARFCSQNSESRFTVLLTCVNLHDNNATLHLCGSLSQVKCTDSDQRDVNESPGTDWTAELYTTCADKLSPSSVMHSLTSSITKLLPL